MVLDSVNVEAIGVVASRVVLNNANNFGAFLLKEFGGPVADSAEALNDDSFTSTTHLIELGLLDEGLH